MPWAFVFTLIGGLSISAFPLFSGFVSKSMIVAAGFEDGRTLAAFGLMLASSGTFLHTGLKVPYFIWFGKNNCSAETWEKAADPPWNMLTAMAITSVLCIGIGCYTPYLYDMLPYPVDYHPYTAYHVSETLQILLFTAAGFFLFRKRLEPEPTISLDLDWFYRKGALPFMWFARRPVNACNEFVSDLYSRVGLRITMAGARVMTWFDREGIDGVIDGSAKGIIDGGDKMRLHITGKLQHYIGGAAVLLFIILAVVLLMR
jgi:multicomponent Na+:H+ antiporter subunit D